MKNLYLFLVLSFMAITLNAHETWLILDEKKNEARLYFGHFVDDDKERGEKFSRVKEGVVYPKGLVKEIKREDDHIYYTLTKKSDIVVVQESEPRKSRQSGLTTRRIAYSKAGRTFTEALTSFDLIPLEKNSNTFKLLYNGKALADEEVFVTSSTGWSKSFYTDEKGVVSISTPWQGTYLLQASFEDETKGEVNKKAFDKTINILTCTIENNK